MGMRNLIIRILREQYSNNQLEILKRELEEIEEDYDDIIEKYNYLKKRIEILEYRTNTPYNLGTTKDRSGNEYYNVRIDYPYVKNDKKFPYYRIYVGSKKEIDSMSPDEREKRIQHFITRYLDKNFPL